jgi:hypothetical protein
MPQGMKNDPVPVIFYAVVKTKFLDNPPESIPDLVFFDVTSDYFNSTVPEFLREYIMVLWSALLFFENFTDTFGNKSCPGFSVFCFQDMDDIVFKVNIPPFQVKDLIGSHAGIYAQIGHFVLGLAGAFQFIQQPLSLIFFQIPEPVRISGGRIFYFRNRIIALKKLIAFRYVKAGFDQVQYMRSRLR